MLQEGNAIATDALLTQVESYVRRVWRVLRVLVEMHLDIAQQEANREQQRIVIGVGLLLLGGSLLFFATLWLNIAAVCWIHTLGWSWLLSIASVGGGELLVGSILLAIALRTLGGAYMVETRARLASTTATLLNEEE